MDSPYLISFIADTTPDIRDVHQRCQDQGLRASLDGQKGECDKYRIGLESYQDETLEGALSELERADRGTLYMWTETDMRVGITVTQANGSGRLGEWWGRLRIGFQTSDIDWGHQDTTTVRTRIDELVTLGTELTQLVDPEFTWSAIYDENQRQELVIPEGRPIRNNVTDLSWITVMSNRVIEQFGGREHVLKTPAWRVIEVDTGHIMLVLRDHPYDPTEEELPDGSWKRHLLRD